MKKIILGLAATVLFSGFSLASNKVEQTININKLDLTSQSNFTNVKKQKGTIKVSLSNGASFDLNFPHDWTSLDVLDFILWLDDIWCN
ncbi:MAG: hypothetical protein JST62_04250 [Bacteroidetes bacterium]|nr:hypothetical protein [Bacteroidota bacterium]